jgi:hypothetical protein
MGYHSWTDIGAGIFFGLIALTVIVLFLKFFKNDKRTYVFITMMLGWVTVYYFKLSGYKYLSLLIPLGIINALFIATYYSCIKSGFSLSNIIFFIISLAGSFYLLPLLKGGEYIIFLGYFFYILSILVAIPYIVIQKMKIK